VGQQQYPCVKLFEGLANDYDDGGILLSFEQIWLSSRVQSLQTQSVESAEPRLPCDPSQAGGGGIWICVESNGQPDCQGEEFVIKGDQSINVSGTGSTGSTGGTGGTTDGVTNLQYDYIPPQNPVTGFSAESGDGKVVIRWARAEVPDISGFRALCADMAGNPAITGKVGGVPTGRSRTDGKLYYTAENLCGDDIKWQPDPNATPEPTPPSTTGDTDTGRDTEATSSDGTTAMGIDAPWLGDGWSMATTGTTGDTGSTTGDTGSTTGDTTDTGTGSGGITGGELSDSPLASLDWAYVCSDHVSASGTKIEITGLDNGTEYQFIIVAYDSAGNPRVMSDVLTAIPIETSDFWEQCELQGDVCGNGGFCVCSSEPEPTGAAWLGTGLLLLGLSRRRREPRR
jgi:MYXO-CTERM domain-containing protein